MIKLGILLSLLVCIAACSQATTPTATPKPAPTATPIPAPSSYTKAEAVEALENYLNLRGYVSTTNRTLNCLWIMQTREEFRAFYEPNEHRWLIVSGIEGKEWPVFRDVPVLKWYFYERTGAIESIVVTRTHQYGEGEFRLNCQLLTTS